MYYLQQGITFVLPIQQHKLFTMTKLRYFEPNIIALVAQFHELFKQPILTEPAIPSKDRSSLRVDLLQEELDELRIAIEKKDIVGVADALADIQYVLSGTVLEFGLASRFGWILNEVHRSNMSKACDTQEEAVRTIERYRNEEGVTAYAYQDGDKWIVRRVLDNKTLKSINYSPANIKLILEDI